MDASELKRRFGQHIQRLREAAALTQEGLAERIGRSVDTVSNIERGVNATRIEVAYAIATAVGVRLPDLFAFDGEPRARPASETADALGELVEACDEATGLLLVDLVRVGLRLAGRG